MYNLLLINVINEKIGINETKQEQKDMTDKVGELKDFILLKEENIAKKNTRSTIEKAKTKTQRKEILTVQNSFIKNELKLYDKRDIVINAFVNKYILFGYLEAEVYYIPWRIRIRIIIWRKYTRKNKNEETKKAWWRKSVRAGTKNTYTRLNA